MTKSLYENMINKGQDTLDHSALLLELEDRNPEYKLP